MNDSTKRLERIELKLDDSNDHLAKIDVILEGQHISLKEHIRRTTLIEQQLVPISKHVNMVKGGLALIGALGVIASIIEAIKLLIR